MSILVGLASNVPAQAPSSEPVTLLEIQVQNVVTYWDDVADPSKLASSPGIAAPAARNFMRWIAIGDIVSVNGNPVKGTEVFRATAVNLTTKPSPGQAIADTLRGNIDDLRFEIQQTDGTPIGTIMAIGINGGSAPPGAPTRATGGNHAIVGGTGAFLGISGQVEGVTSSARQASMIEDPADRRTNGGGATSAFILHLIPMSRPGIVSALNGPAVAHSSDFSLVTANNPAKVGEILSLFATGLGPVRANVDPGQPFPANPLAVVNSPVDVTVNGTPAEVLAAVGYPGSADGYQVNFRVPDGLGHGTAQLELSAAWITSSAVMISIQ